MPGSNLASFKYYQIILAINRERRTELLIFFSKTFEMVNTKLKPILPSLREKKRYLVFEVISKDKVTGFDEVSNAIMESALGFLGQLGAAKAGILPLANKWNPELQRGIIKVGHKHVDGLRASLAYATKIGNREAIFRSLGVSGILKKAENNYLINAK